MKNLLVVISSNHGLEPETRMCVEALREKGASYIEQSGTSDVAMARNIALTLACEELKKHPSLETVLMVDDDMFFKVKDAIKVLAHCDKTKNPTSGCAVTKKGVFAHRPISKTKWTGGLFFLAIPRKNLLELANISKNIEIRDNHGTWSCIAFTWTGAEDGHWVGEDNRLCQRLGGVELAPVGIGHLKKQAIYPGNGNDELNSFIMNALEKM